MNEISESRSITVDMANRYGMDPKRFEQTLRKTVFPEKGSPEELAAFLQVAKIYDLNPFQQQIYAFPKRGGGIQPIVPIDGWMKIVNDHPAMDGMEFEDKLTDEGNLYAILCRIYRKDRSHPTTVTEYLNECQRDSEPWKKWPGRMLRHKAAIQCARYAFSFSGIIDPDEYERGVGFGADAKPVKSAYRARKDRDWELLIGEIAAQQTEADLHEWGLKNQHRIGQLPDEEWKGHLRDVYKRRMGELKGKPVEVKEAPFTKLKEGLQKSIEQHDAETGVLIDDEIPESGGDEIEKYVPDANKYLDGLDAEMAGAKTNDDLDEVWGEHMAVQHKLFPPDQDKAQFLFERHEARLKADAKVPRKKT